MSRVLTAGVPFPEPWLLLQGPVLSGVTALTTTLFLPRFSRGEVSGGCSDAKELQIFFLLNEVQKNWIEVTLSGHT